MAALSEMYVRQSRAIYSQLDSGIDFTAWLMTVLGAVVVLL